MKNKLLNLTTNQKNILIGVILGDACLETQNNGKTYRIKFAQSNQHKDYLFHLYDIFKNFVGTKPKYKLSNKAWYFNTLTYNCFIHYGNAFYPQGIKLIPRELKDWLTPIGLAYWFMDDGSIKSKESKGVILNTHNFTLLDVKKLCYILRLKYKLNVWPRKQKHKGKIYYQIYISGYSYEKLRSLIFPYIIPEMQYKFPLPRRNK